jgi:hypothetical protein
MNFTALKLKPSNLLLKMFGSEHANLDDRAAQDALAAISKRFGVALSWAKAPSLHQPYAIHQVITDDGEVIGSGMLREEAIQEVFSKCLSTIPVHAQTLGEFRKNTLVIPVKEGHVDAKTGLPYLMIVNDPFVFNTKFHADNFALENELGRIFDRGTFPTIISRKEWIAAGVKNLMEPFKNHIIFFALPGGKNIILSKSHGTDVAYLFHKNEVSNARGRGNEVPAEVLLDYPDFLETSPRQ